MARSPSETLDLPVLPLRDVVVFPHMVIPLFVGRDKSMRALEQAMAADKRIFPTLTARMTSEISDRIDDVLDTIGLTALRFQPAGILSHGQKQWLEIGMLLMQRPRLLLVDEPVAGMTEQEMERTAELLTGLAGKQSVVVVEHDMGFVRSIARKVTVLHQGSVLAEGSMDQVSNDPKVVEVYLGADEEEMA